MTMLLIELPTAVGKIMGLTIAGKSHWVLRPMRRNKVNCSVF